MKMSSKKVIKTQRDLDRLLSKKLRSWKRIKVKTKGLRLKRKHGRYLGESHHQLLIDGIFESKTLLYLGFDRVLLGFPFKKLSMESNLLKSLISLSLFRVSLNTKLLQSLRSGLRFNKSLTTFRLYRCEIRNQLGFKSLLLSMGYFNTKVYLFDSQPFDALALYCSTLAAIRKCQERAGTTQLLQLHYNLEGTEEVLKRPSVRYSVGLLSQTDDNVIVWMSNVKSVLDSEREFFRQHFKVALWWFYQLVIKLKSERSKVFKCSC